MSGPSATTRAEVMRRCGGRCEYLLSGCQKKATAVHHVVKREHGGSNGAENLRGICGVCHKIVHKDEARALANGWIAHPTPAPDPPAPPERPPTGRCGAPHPVWEHVRCTRFAGHRAHGSGAESDLRHCSVVHYPVGGPQATWWS